MGMYFSTGVGPVRYSKRLGTKTRIRANSGESLEILGTGVQALPKLVELSLKAVALVVLAFWAVLVVYPGLGFGILSGAAHLFGAHDLGMKFAKASHWSWHSVPALWKKIKVKALDNSNASA